MPWMTPALVITGMLCIAAGLFFILLRRIPYFGNQPGDIYWRGRHESLAFPIAVCLLAAILLTLFLVWFFRSRTG